jgi:hypothetical protein
MSYYINNISNPQLHVLRVIRIQRTYCPAISCVAYNRSAWVCVRFCVASRIDETRRRASNAVLRHGESPLHLRIASSPRDVQSDRKSTNQILIGVPWPWIPWRIGILIMPRNVYYEVADISLMPNTSDNVFPIFFATRSSPALPPLDNNEESHCYSKPDEARGYECILVAHVKPRCDPISLQDNH